MDRLPREHEGFSFREMKKKRKGRLHVTSENSVEGKVNRNRASRKGNVIARQEREF